jgi:hypothetical protein
MPGSYHDLRVWQRSMKLVLSVYAATQLFPKQELYGLVSQMRRAAVSIPSNIAEGKGVLQTVTGPISSRKQADRSSNWRHRF